MLRRMDRKTMDDLRRFKALVENQPPARVPLDPVAIPTTEQLRAAVSSSLETHPT